MICQIAGLRRVDDRMSTRRTRPPLLLAASVALTAGTLAAPGVATAQSCQGAPGASAIQQYCEAVPRGDGGRDTAGGGGTSGGGSGGSGAGVNAATSSALAQAGRDGAAVRRLVGEGSSSAKKRKSGKSGKSGASGGGSGSTSTGGSGTGGAGGVSGSGAAAGPKDPSGSPLNAAKNAASNGPTAGPAVAWSIVGLSVFGALAAVGLRRQRGALPRLDGTADESDQG